MGSSRTPSIYVIPHHDFPSVASNFPGPQPNKMTNAELTRPALVPSTRFALAIACFLGSAVVYMLRTSLSMAIVCMINKPPKNETANKCDPDPVGTSPAADLGDIINATTAAPPPQYEFDWSTEQEGMVMSSFFYGYLFSQVLGGMIAAKFGGKRVILGAMLLAAIFTLMSPVAARTHMFGLMGMRAAIGFTQGAVFPAMHSMWSQWAPPQESSVLTSISYAGTQFGNIIVLPLGGFLCTYGPDGGWPSIFYLLGLVGVLWCAVWMYMAADRPANHPRISAAEKNYIIASQEATMGKTSAHAVSTPWIELLTSRAVWACWFGHFAGDWGAYTMLVCMPSFLSDVLGLELQTLGLLSAVPYIAYFVMINVGGVVSDYLRAKNIMSTLNMRRTAILIALIGQAVFLVLSTFCGCGQDGLVIFFLTVGMALSGLQFSSYVVNYIDIASAHSGTVMGIGNTMSCLGGIISPMITSKIVVQKTQGEWQVVMMITAAILVAGSVLFCVLAKGEVEPWARNSEDAGEEMEEMQPLRSGKKEDEGKQ
ncbi:slc-17.2 [Pristionchus pacificus]|uniref:Sialin n=1 Tax=Pristionchus pacificus TaxID=54126 RepID=A0A2A6CHK6_PRIPA|nr:slc-17.2 [Pristionchus pacificus]|eukprot:PDM77570.1 slc-17.2 [Pristionchus pacificus]